MTNSGKLILLTLLSHSLSLSTHTYTHKYSTFDQRHGKIEIEVHLLFHSALGLLSCSYDEREKMNEE